MIQHDSLFSSRTTTFRGDIRTMTSIGRRRPAWHSLCGALAGLTLTAAVGHAQEAPTEAQQQEYVALATIVGAALQGKIVPTGEPFGWANDFLKSSDQTTFVPFTLSIERTKVSTPRAALYIFVSARGATATVGSGGATQPPMPVFEDAYHVDLGAPNADGFYQVRRGFWAPAGEYDVYVALSESAVTEGAEPQNPMMLKKLLSVPDMWSDQLTTSTVMLAERVEPLSEPLPPEQQLANPYTLGTLRVVPKRTVDYLTSDDLSMVFLVYNVGLTGTGMPDVNIDYSFSTRGVAGDEFFNVTSPQTFNAETLPAGFDFAGGHQLIGGQAVPLSEFPVADYRLEITVTDNTNGASLIHNVDFTVSAS